MAHLVSKDQRGFIKGEHIKDCICLASNVNSKKMVTVSSKKVYPSYENGGLGIRSLITLNEETNLKLGWNMMASEDSWVKLPKARTAKEQASTNSDATDQLTWPHDASGKMCLKVAYLIKSTPSNNLPWTSQIWNRDIPPSKSMTIWKHFLGNFLLVISLCIDGATLPRFSLYADLALKTWSISFSLAVMPGGFGTGSTGILKLTSPRPA
ncbi:hypothetical protein KIW84_073033 [Lathyrus oleraceus]|uniref:Uncharacterized protein n=1 Tax=Pisum sativum TaxID=3888 RepID=A0A9D4VMJ4_PEA|nr:hypothetical protein KIW84_073033 [Pisum sativum]